MLIQGATTPVNQVKPAINFNRVQHETWPSPKRRVGLEASVYICQGDRWLTIRDNGNIAGHWRSALQLQAKVCRDIVTCFEIVRHQLLLTMQHDSVVCWGILAATNCKTYT